METKNIYFISGIDTDAGKSYCTAWYARELMQRGLRVITQKFIQTGNTGHSEDIDLHRRLTGTGYLPEDKEGLTMPEIFSYPCSPHLAARIDKRPIDFGKIERATRELSHRYDTVLVEGAGGLMVPLTEDFLTIDYIAEKQYPLIFVTSGKLGSINHTLLSFEAIKNRDIALDTVLYNLYPTVEDKTIQEDTMKYIKCDVSTVCIGMAASMGAFLLAGGAKGKRFALPNAEIMIHQPLGGTQGQATEIEIAAKHILRTKEKLNRMLAENTGKDYETICADTERDNWKSAEEACEYGLIDKVITFHEA